MQGAGNYGLKVPVGIVQQTQKNSKVKHLRVENSGLIVAPLQPIESMGYGPRLTKGRIDLME